MSDRSYSHNSGSANGTGNIITGVGTVGGTMSYWNSGGGGSAIFDIINSPDPSAGAPWNSYQIITATHLLSGQVDLTRMGGYWASRVLSAFSGGGNTGRLSTFFELV